MIYTVLWLPNAEEELAAIWMNAMDRGAVTATSFAIDQQLRSDP